ELLVVEGAAGVDPALFGEEADERAAPRVHRTVAQIERDLLLQVAQAVGIDVAEQGPGLGGVVGDALVGVEEVEEAEVIRALEPQVVMEERAADSQAYARTVVLVGILDAELIGGGHGEH